MWKGPVWVLLSPAMVVSPVICKPVLRGLGNSVGFQSSRRPAESFRICSLAQHPGVVAYALGNKLGSYALVLRTLGKISQNLSPCFIGVGL
jgi:hypothetical protein